METRSQGRRTIIDRVSTGTRDFLSSADLVPDEFMEELTADDDAPSSNNGDKAQDDRSTTRRNRLALLSRNSTLPPDHEDVTLTSCRLFEAPVEQGYISDAGLHFIAQHQYKPSEYTHLDNLLNPMWTWLTEFLPMWLAPNMVTTLGGLHAAVAYAILWYYSPDFKTNPPDWTFILAGWCAIAYYTLDCMDGKQARRTGSSSPLGQLFDHGVDCLCTQFFMAVASSYAMFGGTYSFILVQTTLQLAFFMAQWEEYNTHILPHCTGKWVGVSEVNYMAGFASIVNGCLDREAFFFQPMKEVVTSLSKLPGMTGEVLIENLPTVVQEMELRYFLVCCWGAMSTLLMILSVRRVMVHENIAGATLYPPEISERRFNAVSKLVTPVALCVAAFSFPLDEVRTRYISVPLGLAFSLMTMKMIVFSMAKQPFGIVQWDAVPFVLAAVWIRYDHRLTGEGANLVLGVMSAGYAVRLLCWANVTINQICHKLNIYCFRLKKRKEE